MKVADDHMFHGAALLQIAEDPRFTAINSIDIAGQRSHSAYRINDTTGIFMKYASNPSGNRGKYLFTFTEGHLQELDAIDSKMGQTFIALVCVEDREIACLTFKQLKDLVARRLKAKGTSEKQYAVSVTAPERKSLRAYVDEPGKRKRILGRLLINRKLFPGALFV